MHNNTFFNSCSAALCPDPRNISNGIVTFTNNSVNGTATYSCNSGFELIGEATTTCTVMNMNSATFQPVPPSCRGEHVLYTEEPCTVIVDVSVAEQFQLMRAFSFPKR